MTKTLQLKRGTTTANNAYTGSVGEITVDTTTHSIRVHDGSTAGGYTLAPGGEMNVIDTIQLNGTTQTVTNKTVNLAVQEPITSANKLSASLVDDSSTTNKKFVTTTEKNTWNGKQDSISDLGTIRTNASEALKQKSTLPTANADNLGKIYQFTGTTTASLTNGYIYQCNEHEIESSYTKEATGTVSADWIYVTLETFEETYSTTGDYTFSYDGENWSIGGETIDLGTIGIGIGGPSDSGDTFTIHYVAAHTEYAWDGIQVTDLSSKQDVLTAGANISIDGSTISASSYTDELQYFGISDVSNVWTFSSYSADMKRPNKIESGKIYKISNNSLVPYETIDTTTTFGGDLPRNAGKTYVLFYGENLVSDLGVEKNYIWVDKDNIYYGDTLEGSDETMVWFETQYGGGYTKTIKYTNDSGTTWSEISLPLISIKFESTEYVRIEKQNNYNVSMFGFERFIIVQGTTVIMVPAGKTDKGKNRYEYKTLNNYLNRVSSLPEGFNGYAVKAPWTTTYGDFTVNEDNAVVFNDTYGQTYVDDTGNFVPYMKYVNGEPTPPHAIVAIDSLQNQITVLDNQKADRKEVEVVNSKVEAGIVYNPSLATYTINGRSLTITGGYYWIPYSRTREDMPNDVKNEISTDRQGGMTVTIPEGVTTKKFLYEKISGEYEEWCWDYTDYSEDVFYPSASDDDRYMEPESVYHLYAKLDTTTLDKIYTTNNACYEGDKVFKVVELENGTQITQYLGTVSSVSEGTILAYTDMFGEEHTGNYTQHTDVYEKTGQHKDTVLSAEYTTVHNDDPRQTIHMYWAATASGTNPNPFGYIYWDGEKFVDQKSIIVCGSRISIMPGVRVVMYNGTDSNDLPSMLDYTVDRSIVSFMTLEMSGTYTIILTNENELLFSKNVRVDLPTNVLYVDNVATIGCKIGTITVHNMFIEDWEIDSPYRLVTQEQLTNELDNIDKVKSQTTGYIKFWTGTQTEYDLITTKDPMTLYIILPAQA